VTDLSALLLLGKRFLWYQHAWESAQIPVGPSVTLLEMLSLPFVETVGEIAPMPMELFYHRCPEIAGRETRTLHVLGNGGRFPLPKNEYGFIEFYCNEKGCDCRRVMIRIMTPDSKESLATINMGFESDRPDAGPFLDPLSPQSPYADTLMQCFLDEVNNDPAYLARLQRHYVMFKEMLEGHRYRGRAFEAPGSVVRTKQDPGQLPDLLDALASGTQPDSTPVRRPSKKIGRNDPCPCGSGKKYKKCCLTKGELPPDTNQGRRQAGQEGGATDHAADAQLLVARAAGRDGGERPIELADSELLAARPRLVLALLDLLLEVYAPDGRQVEPPPEFEACLLLLEEGLTQIRYSVERSRPWAVSLSKEIQQGIAERAFLPEVDVRVSQGLLRAMYESKLDLHPAIKAQSEKLAEYYASFAAGRDGVPDLSRAIEHLAKDAEDPFELFEALVAQFSTVPEEAQALAFAAAALQSRNPMVLEMAALSPLHPNRTVARMAASGLAGAWRPDAVSSVAMRRLVALRSWLPAGDRPAVGELIKVLQKAGAAAGAGPAHLHAPGADSLLASAFDGSGIQAAWWLRDRKRPYGTVGVLVKQGEGIRDVLLQMDLTKGEIMNLAQDFRRAGTAAKTVRTGYGDRLMSHFLWVGTEHDHPPPVRLLQTAETLGGAYWQPQRMDADAELARLEGLLGKRLDSSPELVQRILERSADWPSEEEFASSWFEDDARVDTLLGDAVGPPERWLSGMERATQVLMKELLEAKRELWAERMLWMALWAESVEGRRRPPWEGFTVLARLLRDGVPLGDIPLMHAVATRSVQSALRRAKVYGQE
jgi:hypothetical protein